MAVTREMKITYGGQAIPGTNSGANLELHSVHRISKGPEEASITFQFLVDAVGSASTLGTSCAALETLFNTRRNALVVTVDGNEILNLKDSDNSGFDVTPSIDKVGSTDPQYDTNTSRMYEVTITAGLPSLGTAGLRDFEFDVVFAPSRLGTLTVRGTYTATLGGAGATAVYQAGIVSRITTITDDLTGVWELQSETYTPDDQDQVVRFERVLQELIFNQVGTVLDHPALVGAVLIISEEEVEPANASPAAAVAAPGGGVGVTVTAATLDVTPLVVLTAEFTTEVDHTVSKELQSLWEETIRPFVISQMTIVGGESLILTRVRPEFNFTRNTIRASVEAVVVGASAVLERTIETRDDIDFGKSISDVWPRDEDVPDDEASEFPAPTPAHVYQGPRKILRVITTTTVERVGGAGGAKERNHRSAATSREALPTTTIEGGTFQSVRISRSVTGMVNRRGIKRLGNTLQTVTRISVETFRILFVLGATEGGGAGGGVGGAVASGGSGGRGGG